MKLAPLLAGFRQVTAWCILPRLGPAYHAQPCGPQSRTCPPSGHFQFNLGVKYRPDLIRLGNTPSPRACVIVRKYHQATFAQRFCYAFDGPSV